MRRILLIVTKPPGPLNDVVMGMEEALPGREVERFDLTQEAPDYGRLLQAIFASDSVQVW